MKNIVVCCDGTWNTDEKKSVTNVEKLFNQFSGRKDKTDKETGVTTKTCSSPDQIIYYDRGVGTSGWFGRRMHDGVTGAGLDANIKQAYRFLTKTYQPGDNIYLFGFSRGAYTVRSLVGLISHSGILKSPPTENAALDQALDQAFRAYRNGTPKSEEAKNATYPMRGIVPQDQAVLSIRFLGVWDTVGALGIPGHPNLEKKYGFHNTKLSPIVEEACHALAIDEKREGYPPTLWESSQMTKSRQKWFVGAHSDVGGGYDKRALSDITLAWMTKHATNSGLHLLRPAALEKSDLGIKALTPHLHDSSSGFLWKSVQFILRWENPLRKIGIHSEDERVSKYAKLRFEDDGVDYKPLNLATYLNYERIFKKRFSDGSLSSSPKIEQASEATRNESHEFEQSVSDVP